MSRFSRYTSILCAVALWLIFVSPCFCDEQGTVEPVRIGVGDLLDIAVFDSPELSAKIRVDATGVVALPLLGNLRVEGLFPQQAQTLIENKLRDSGFVRDPQVLVAVAEYGAQGITVLGEVKNPGVYPPSASRTLIEVLSRAEGLTQYASQTVVLRHRSAPDQPITIRLNDSPEKLTGANTEVFPGDVVYVPKAGLVYVVGDVGKPGGFVMDGDKTTVLQALALAGGINRTSSPANARIIRKSDAGPQEIGVDLKKLLASKSTDTPMLSGDVLFVPGSATKGAMKRGAEAILQVATGVIIYRR